MTFKAIQTKFLSATDYRGSRIKASANGVKSFTLSYPHELDSYEAHLKAAKGLADRQGWDYELVGGTLLNEDYAWIMMIRKGA